MMMPVCPIICAVVIDSLVAPDAGVAEGAFGRHVLETNFQPGADDGVAVLPDLTALLVGEATADADEAGAVLDDHVAHGASETALALMHGDDGAVLGVDGLDLEPGVRALALRVGGSGVLDHGALEALRDEATERIGRRDAKEGRH